MTQSEVSLCWGAQGVLADPKQLLPVPLQRGLSASLVAEQQPDCSEQDAVKEEQSYKDGAMCGCHNTTQTLRLSQNRIHPQ